MELDSLYEREIQKVSMKTCDMNNAHTQAHCNFAPAKTTLIEKQK
jgi:hypothetical protein